MVAPNPPGQTYLNFRTFLTRAARRDPLHAGARTLPGNRSCVCHAWVADTGLLRKWVRTGTGMALRSNFVHFMMKSNCLLAGKVLKSNPI